jgi:ATP-dependent DNA ligase
MWLDSNWVAEEKYDGDRRIAQFVPAILGSRVRFTGTRESVDGTGFVEKTDNLPHLNRAPDSLKGTVLDGEMTAPFAKDFPGGKSKYVTAIMGSGALKAIAKQERAGWLTYVVFDCLYFQGMDVRGMTLDARRSYVLKALALWEKEYAVLVKKHTGDKQAYFKQILRAGGEGVILKNIHHTYGNEKLWVKVKGEWTADVVITGFEPGKGKYSGTLGALVFAQYVGKQLTKMGTCSGMTDTLRDQIWHEKARYDGWVIEVVHNGREPTGAFRHPRFSRFRPDKSPKDCIYREGET